MKCSCGHSACGPVASCPPVLPSSPHGTHLISCTCVGPTSSHLPTPAHAPAPMTDTAPPAPMTDIAPPALTPQPYAVSANHSSSFSCCSGDSTPRKKVAGPTAYGSAGCAKDQRCPPRPPSSHLPYPLTCHTLGVDQWWYPGHHQHHHHHQLQQQQQDRTESSRPSALLCIMTHI